MQHAMLGGSTKIIGRESHREDAELGKEIKNGNAGALVAGGDAMATKVESGLASTG